MSVPNDKLEVSRMGDMGELKTAIHIVVLAKRIPDPEPSAVPFRVDPDTWRRIEVPGLQMVVSPYDEQCIEVALRLREQLGGARITVLSLGRGRGEDIKLFKRVFSWEVDAGVFLCDPAFDGLWVTEYYFFTIKRKPLPWMPIISMRGSSLRYLRRREMKTSILRPLK